MSEKQKEKILILTLGTGKRVGIDASIEEDELEAKLKETIEKKEFNYDAVEYQMDNEAESTPSEFVAEPLTKSFRPDKIFIIGTVKSSWASFLSKFGNLDLEKIAKLYKIQESHGIQTKEKELEEVTKEINEILKKGIVKEPFHEVKEIQAIVTRYGINEEELLENYQLISGIGKYLRKDVSYEIAFDITHSFRSMPIYNLVILNYFKQVSQYDITISHVYYGNVEVRRENQDIASIVDLADLVQVLDLTNGTSEFKNTGNAETLLSLIPDEEKELRNALEKFDWATQINAFNRVEESLTDLMEIIGRKSSIEGNKYADLKGMIEEVILKKFFVDNGITYVNNKEFLQLPIEEKKYAICNWYLKQNRYGQAVATALEALRSYLVPFYLKYKNVQVNEKNCENEEYRKAALDILAYTKTYYDKSGKKPDYAAQAVCQLECCRQCAKQVRDNFAHNLNEKIELKCDKCKDCDDYFISKHVIKRFIFMLGRFRKILKSNPEGIMEIYKEKLLKGNRGLKNHRSVRLIVSPDAQVNFSEFQQGINKRYDVYYLDEKIMKKIKEGTEGKDKTKTTVKNAIFLARYIKSFEFDPESLHVCLCNLDIGQMIYYTAMLNYYGIRHVYINKESVINFGYELNQEKYDNQILDNEREQLMNLDLKLYKV